MKKLMILIIAFLGSLQISKAQTEKGSQTLGANLGFTYLNDNSKAIDPSIAPVSNISNKSTSFNIGPNYSYFIADKLDIGASLLYGHINATYNTDQNYADKSITQDYGASIFIRKYYMFQDKIGFRSGAFVGYYRDKRNDNYTSTAEIPNTYTTTNNYNAGLDLDLVYYPSKKLGLAANIASLSYDHAKGTIPGGRENTDNVNFNFINSGLTLSAFYVFD